MQIVKFTTDREKMISMKVCGGWPDRGSNSQPLYFIAEKSDSLLTVLRGHREVSTTSSGDSDDLIPLVKIN